MFTSKLHFNVTDLIEIPGKIEKAEKKITESKTKLDALNKDIPKTHFEIISQADQISVFEKKIKDAEKDIIDLNIQKKSIIPANIYDAIQDIDEHFETLETTISNIESENSVLRFSAKTLLFSNVLLLATLYLKSKK